MTKTTTAAQTETLVDADVVDEQPTANLPATIPNGTVATLQDNEWSSIGDGDLAPADETLLPVLPMNRNLGEGVLDPSTGEKTDTLQFIWLARMVTRAWWPVPFDERDPSDPAPKCRSVDGLHGQGEYGPGSTDNPSGKCATCPRNTWTPEKGVPACNASIEAMIAMPDLGADGEVMGANLYRLRFGGIAYAKARAFWDSFRARVPVVPAIAFLSEMVLEPTDTKNGKKLAPAFSRIRQFRLAEVQAIVARRDELIDEFRRLTAEDVEAGAGAVDVAVDERRGEDAGGPFDGPPDQRPYTDDPPASEDEAVAKVAKAFGNEGVDHENEPF